MKICEKAINNYIKFIENNFSCKEKNGQIFIVTPFTLPDNDIIELKIEPLNNEEILLSDNCLVYDYLFFSGIEIENSSRRKRILNNKCRQYNVKFEKGELKITGNYEKIETYINKLINAIQEISLLTYTSRRIKKSSFKSEVSNFLNENKINYKQDYPFDGYSKEHKIDFFVKSKELEKVNLIQTINENSISISKVEKIAFAFSDIKRKNKYVNSISLIEDKNKNWTETQINILKSYSKLIKWNQKDKLLTEIA
ncbi:DUF1828 domain-containing protein [Sporohalobacter salinus]|uniref:DUF1828 domain-containing protein n=1 Tax=Sporohalobacter salinus TaxID=1494606 RepID=UPI001960B282|nr:DUF1828 domain-containing protein [Sporohalobacter salinus]MBM7624745.1 putative adenine nucleotide alpha hydrolase (AANH) superfamily ATPase [Sporohalobacter salinus]